MAELKVSLEAAGFLKVTTYIQSGNLVLKTACNKQETAERIEALIDKDFGFDVPAMVISQDDLAKLLDTAPFKEAEPKKRYFSLLLSKPFQTDKVSFEALTFVGEEFEVFGNCIYLHCKNGAAKAKLGNTLIEKKLKVSATTRNLNTMNKMLQIAADVQRES